MDEHPNNGETPWLEIARRYLESRGVLARTADELRVELIEHPPPELLEKFLRFSPEPVPEAILVFPNLVPDTDKLLVDGYSLRFFPPHQYNGKERKFLRTKGGDYRPYIAPAIWPATSRLEVPLFIVEKQVVAMLLYQLGFSAIALEGTWGAGQPQTDEEKVKNAKRTLHRDLAKFSWAGRTVYLCFDTDFTRRESVLEGLIRTFTLLTVAGADVRVLRWNDAFKGLDDFVATQAGLDLTRQKELVSELIKPLDKLEPRQATALWVKPNYLSLFEREGRLVSMSAAARNNLGHLITKPLGASVGSLEKSWNDASEAGNGGSSDLVDDLPPWQEEVNGTQCAQKISDVIRVHVHMRDEDTWAITCWIFLSALMDRVTILPIAGITSPIKRCGKTNLLGVLRRLCRKALAASAISSAGVYRTINFCKPTLLIDEADTFLPENDELRGIINSGHTTEQAYKILFDLDTKQPEKLSTFCPKAIALIGELPSTLVDRAIEIKMGRKPKHIKTKPVRKVPVSAYNDLARQVRRWAEDNWEGVLNAEACLPEGLNDRAAENWEILAQIAAVLGEPWPKRIFEAATLIGGEDDSEGQTIGIYLLNSLRTLFREKNLDQPGTTELTLESGVICDALNKDSHAPWADWGKGDKKGITQRKLAAELRKWIKPVHARTKFKTIRGYRWVDLEPVFKQYLSEDSSPDDGESGDTPVSPDRSEPCGENEKKERTQDFTPESQKESAQNSNAFFTNDLSVSNVKNTIGTVPIRKTGIDTNNTFVQNDLQICADSFSPKTSSPLCSAVFKVISTPEALFSYLDALPGDLSRVALDIETFVPRNVMSQYFPFQLVGIRFALNHTGTLLADEMGVGKTIQAIGLINADPTVRKIIVVCTASMRLIWKRELEKWLVRDHARIGIIGLDPRSSQELLSESDIVIINYDRLHRVAKELRQLPYDLAIQE